MAAVLYELVFKVRVSILLFLAQTCSEAETLLHSSTDLAQSQPPYLVLCIKTFKALCAVSGAADSGLTCACLEAKPSVHNW